MQRKRRFRITFNSPAVLLFAGLCLVSLLLSYLTNGRSTRLFFSVYRCSLLDPLGYVRLIGHVFGHGDWAHFLGNMTLLLVTGPMLEEKYGSANICFVILLTALSTGLVHFLFFPDTALLGASGVVFAFILLASFGSLKEGDIPLTFLLVAVLYIGGEIYDGLFVRDNISNLTHILGGLVGSFCGFFSVKTKKTE